MQLAVVQIEPKAIMSDTTGISLGTKVRDPISGFSGIATMRNTYLHSTPRLGVEAQVLDKDGKPMEPQWFEESRLEVVATETVP